ncbi:MAG TPA: hypothetical protein VE891_08020 [Allosphingosinicella sp.]|nr:hypothetical protein [Allosphingosinicella sp.]
MPEGKKRVFGTIAASILLAASLAAGPAIAAKRPPPPPVEDPDDPWYGCTPWGPVIYGAECCDYPELVIPCQGPNPPIDPVIIPLEAKSGSSAG